MRESKGVSQESSIQKANECAMGVNDTWIRPASGPFIFVKVVGLSRLSCSFNAMTTIRQLGAVIVSEVK